MKPINTFILSAILCPMLAIGGPCDDSAYVALKAKPIAEMNQSESTYFSSMHAQCLESIRQDSIFTAQAQADSIQSVEDSLAVQQKLDQGKKAAGGVVVIVIILVAALGLITWAIVQSQIDNAKTAAR